MVKVNRRNRLVDLSKFNKRLTEWSELSELTHAADNFLQDDSNGYGNSFVVKRNNVSKKFAIFIYEGNELRRVNDNALKFNIGDLLLSKIQYKKEGISILKTFLMTK